MYTKCGISSAVKLLLTGHFKMIIRHSFVQMLQRAKYFYPSKSRKFYPERPPLFINTTSIQGREPIL